MVAEPSCSSQASGCQPSRSAPTATCLRSDIRRHGRAQIRAERSADHLLPGQTAYGSQVAFSHDGRSVATASHDGTVRIWRATPLELRSTTVGGRFVADVRPLRDGFVTVGVDDQPRGGNVVVQRWRSPVARERPLVLGSFQHIDSAFISADGRMAGFISSPTGPGPRGPCVGEHSEHRVVGGTSPRADSAGADARGQHGWKMACGGQPRAGIHRRAGLAVPTARRRTHGQAPWAPSRRSCGVGWSTATFSLSSSS